MPDETVPRMYGITCPNSSPRVHAIRLGKECLPLNAPVSALQHAVARREGQIGSTECPVCSNGFTYSLEDVRFVDDSEWPPEHAAVHF